MAKKGFLTTHVLDTANGVPAQAMKIELFRLEGESATLIKTLVTNHDGRTDQQVLSEDEFAFGHYELRFYVADYFGSQPNSKLFLDKVPVCFHLGEQDHYHVPLLVSPFSYSTYRGS